MNKFNRRNATNSCNLGEASITCKNFLNYLLCVFLSVYCTAFMRNKLYTIRGAGNSRHTPSSIGADTQGQRRSRQHLQISSPCDVTLVTRGKVSAALRT